MLSRSKFLLALIVLITPVVLSNGSVDDVVDSCKTASESFSESEEKYTRKDELGPEELNLAGPQISELKYIAYDREKLQRPFECIADALNESSDSLADNDNYKDLVEECKAKQSTPECDPDYPYRTINGTCNNLEHPERGSVLSCANRFMNASYVGVSGFRRSVCDNRTLPNPRFVSTHYMLSENRPLLTTSSHAMYFGQFVAHDIGDVPVTFVEDKSLDCCKNRSEDQHPQCAPIIVGDFDLFYILHGVDCLNFARTAPCPTCSVDKRIQMNEPTHYIDLSQVYGLTEKESKKIRRLDGSGKLKSQDSKSGEILPPDKTIPSFRCGVHTVSGGGARKKRDLASAVAEPVENDNEYCFKGGDRRINQHTVLMVYHTIFKREHNRICDELQKYNPHWDGEKLYQEARKINIAQFQAIVYKEFLPHFLGKFMTKHSLWLKNGTRTKYLSDVDPSIAIEFSTAAFRLHSMIDQKISLIGYDRIQSSSVRYTFQDSYPVYNDKIEEVIVNLGTWPYQVYDQYMTRELTDYLYKERAGHYGLDLAAVNIHRGRDNGLPPYVDVLKFLSHGKIDIKKFSDLALYMKPDSILLLKSIYCDVRDIDLWVGLNSEIRELDMRISKSAAEIIARQFKLLKLGDRFYFEHPEHFTDEQLQELLKSSLSRIFCDNTKIKAIQPNIIDFPLPTNLVTLCHLLQKVDLSKWKEKEE